MSYKPEFKVGGVWYDNEVRFETREEAEASVRQKFMAWTTPTAYRVSESEDPVNYKMVDGQLAAV